MDPKKLLTADYLDIIFDNRNKSYGGYELRKNYNRRLKKGVGFLMLGLASVVSFSFIRSDKAGALIEHNRPVTTTLIDLPPKPDVPPPPKAATPPPPPAAPAMTKAFTEFKVKDDNDVKPDEMPTEVANITNPGSKNNDSGSIEPPASSGTGTGPAVAVAPPAKAEIPVFVEQMPAFEGDILAYLAKNIHYPEAAREAGIQGRVGIEFIINEDGSITDARVTRAIGAGCDEEALRVIKTMPKWKPGKQNGVATKVRFTQPITFRLN